MVIIYITSPDEAAGKTTLGVGIGRKLTADRKNVGYLKPGGSNGDAAFMKQALALTEPADSLCPAEDKVKEALSKIGADKDVVIIEGNSETAVTDVPGAIVILVGDFSRPESSSRLLKEGQVMGESLVGAVLNKVPKSQLKEVTEETSAAFREAGVPLLGVLPEDRTLLSLTVAELADAVQGKILNSPEKSAEVVENLMVGAMSVDSGVDYFGRKANKAAVVKDYRPDMQMAALETPLRCLVVSGKATPIDYVRYRAEDKAVPIVLTESGTDDIVAGIEEALGRARFSQEKKLKRVADIIGQNLNFPELYRGLGLG